MSAEHRNRYTQTHVYINVLNLNTIALLDASGWRGGRIDDDNDGNDGQHEQTGCQRFLPDWGDGVCVWLPIYVYIYNDTQEWSLLLFGCWPLLADADGFCPASFIDCIACQCVCVSVCCLYVYM